MTREASLICARIHPELKYDIGIHLIEAHKRIFPERHDSPLREKALVCGTPHYPPIDDETNQDVSSK